MACSETPYRFIAVTHGAYIQVWRTPNHLLREFAPFALHRTYTGHHDDVLSIQWAPDSSCFITTSRDMTARLFTLQPLEGFRPKTFAGHRDAVISAYFSADGETVSLIMFFLKIDTDEEFRSTLSAKTAPYLLGKRKTTKMMTVTLSQWLQLLGIPSTG